MRGRGLVDDLPSRCKVPMSPYDFGIIWRGVPLCAHHRGADVAARTFYFWFPAAVCMWVCGVCVCVHVCVCMPACAVVRVCVCVDMT